MGLVFASLLLACTNLGIPTSSLLRWLHVQRRSLAPAVAEEQLASCARHPACYVPESARACS